MSCRLAVKTTVYTSTVAASLFLLTGSSQATDFTAGVIMGKMAPQDRVPYISGVVEGLAYARYLRDEKQTAGMRCIFAWYQTGKDTIDVIYAAFGKYPDYPPAAIIDVLSRKACP